MRISDWSSDVCSSDLPPRLCRYADPPVRAAGGGRRSVGHRDVHPAAQLSDRPAASHRTVRGGAAPYRRRRPRLDRPRGRDRRRSEEHTSELQSLMRISYDVFCLKKQQPTLTPCLLAYAHNQLTTVSLLHS